MRDFKIGEIAKMANVNIETIRFYERKGLISPVKRLESGYRIFSEESLKELKFIKHGKELGFTLKEISELLNLQISDMETCHIVNQKAKEKIKQIENKILLLTKMHDVLLDFSSSCDKREMTERCPIISMINDDNYFEGDYS